MGWGRSEPHEPADVTGSEKPQPKAGTLRLKMLPAKRDGWREMKPNQKEELKPPASAVERTSHP